MWLFGPAKRLQPYGVVPLLEQATQNAADKLAPRLAGGGPHQRFATRSAHALTVGWAGHVPAGFGVGSGLFLGLRVRVRIGLFLCASLGRARLQFLTGGFAVDG